jgi:hypothetical protein
MVFWKAEAAGGGAATGGSGWATGNGWATGTGCAGVIPSFAAVAKGSPGVIGGPAEKATCGAATKGAAGAGIDAKGSLDAKGSPEVGA